jgi:hypothetical protein
MRSVSVETTVDVSVEDVLNEMEWTDIVDYINELATEEQSDFFEILEEKLGGERYTTLASGPISLETALDKVVESYNQSPYLKGLVMDRLSVEKIIQP